MPPRSLDASLACAETKCGGLETDGTDEPAAAGLDQQRPAGFRLAQRRLQAIGGGLRVLPCRADTEGGPLAIRRIIASGPCPAWS